jgi:hypothetical protein
MLIEKLLADPKRIIALHKQLILGQTNWRESFALLRPVIDAR